MGISIQSPPRLPDPPELRLGSDANLLLSGGVSYKYDPTQLRDNQSPYMLNMLAIDNGSILNKRQGQKYVYSTSLGAGGLHGAYERFWMGYKVFAWGTEMYKQQGNDAPVSIKSGLADAAGSFFAFQGKLWYMNGTDFVVIDDSVAAADVTPYVPTLFLAMTPGGSGEPFEQANLLAPAFIIKYSSDGTATKYYFPFTDLDATTVTITVDGSVKTEGTHFTVDRTASPFAFVDFSGGTAPLGAIPSSAPSNVVVTAYKTIAGNSTKITGCRRMIDYGGDNDTRLFAWGNTTFKNRVFRSGLLDATYWPENEYSDVGSSSEAVVACAKHYTSLVYLKERSLAFTTYSAPVSDQVSASFPLFQINGSIGCDCPDTVQIIDNNVVFFNSSLGGFVLVSTDLKDERNVRPISGHINGAPGRPGLLDKGAAELQAATSVDYSGRYWLCVGSDAYVWDYRLSPFVNSGNAAADEDRLSWFPFDNINAGCWIQDERTLYYGDRDAGLFVEFMDNYNDFGDPINGVWRSKRWNFNLPDWLKTVKKAWFTARSGGYSAVTVKYFSEKGEVIDNEMINVNSYRWDLSSWNTWTWFVNEYPPPERLKLNIKKIVYFQIEFSNNEFNQNLSLLALVIQYIVVKKVK